MAPVQWYCLGHACWLIEAAGLRLLVDPLLGPAHQRGLFTVTPTRSLAAEELRPDFVLISHAHPDHFDVPSLWRLARLDPEVVVMSADELVCWAARRLGFRAVHRLAPESLLSLDGPRILTTPSVDADEWGLLIEHQGAVGWHLVDTVLSGEQARGALEWAAQELGLASLRERGPDLSLLRYQPLLETAVSLGEPLRFPLEDYARLLSLAAGLGRGAVVPSSSGSVHGPLYAGMNAAVYPQTEARFLRDVGAYCPALRALPAVVGGGYRVEPGSVELDPRGGRSLLSDEGAPVSAVFRPHAAPALADPNPRRRPEGELREQIERWVRGPLLGALQSEPGRPRVLALEVRFASGEELAYTLRVGSGRVEEVLDPDYDALNAVAASALCDVIEGRASWGDALLGGLLRASARGYEVSEGRVRGLAPPPLFVCEALPYGESVRRAVEREVDELLAAGDATPDDAR